MAAWSFILVPILVAALIHLIIFNKKKSKLPPGPPAIPFLGNLLWLRHSLSEIESILHSIVVKHGPVVTLHVGPHRAIFIADRAVAHKALVEHGASFADRPAPSPAVSLIGASQCGVSSAPYGPLWRLLRRNLISEILHSSRVKLFADGRDWVLGVLLDHLRARSRSSDDGTVVANDSFQFAMFCLLVLMCFGEKLDEDAIREIETVQRDILLYGQKLAVIDVFPKIAKYIYFGRLKTATVMRKKQKEMYIPLIEARREHKRGQHDANERFVYSYLDSLLDIKIPEEGGRNLTDDEMVSLCSEFLNAGTDTTSTALQWTMAELVKHPDKQEKLIEEIVAEGDGAVGEEELQRMPYLKAVVMEGLRRHPPAHFVLPHTVTWEIEIEGYVIPKDASVNFMVAEMGWDERVWEDPMEFRPERFLDGEGQGVDVTGSREIKMMPFGVGRRICPGIGLAMLHLEYFVANLVSEFEWKAVEGEAIDLSEKPEFTVVMKYPLRARLIPRRNR